MAGNADTVKQGFDSFNQGDAQGLEAVWTDDVRWEGSGVEEIPGGGVHEGKQAVMQMAGSIPQRWESFQAIPDEFIEDGDTVVVLGRLEGRTPQGEDVKAPFVHIWRMEAGKGKRVQALTDSLQLGRALGVV
jgi:ketosteroid isomerase-like protein